MKAPRARGNLLFCLSYLRSCVYRDLLSPYLASFRRQTRSLWRSELFPPFPSPFPLAVESSTNLSYVLVIRKNPLSLPRVPLIGFTPRDRTNWAILREERGSRIWMPLNTSWPFYVPPSWYLLPRPKGMRNIETSAEGLSRVPPIVYLFKWKQGLNEKDTW